MTRHTDCHAGQQQQPGTPRGYRLPETDGAKVLPTSDQVGLYLASIHQMAPPQHTSDKQDCYSSTQKDERLSKIKIKIKKEINNEGRK